MSKDSKKLEANSRIAIIGGGPAGSFFALYLLKYAGERGIRPEITIYQQRNFDEPGPKGCKGCAGILSISLLKNLDEIGLTIPKEIIQSRIEHYAVHSPYTSISLSNPEKEIQIASIYRGGGPRTSNYENPVSFDSWLLREVQQRGGGVENQTVTRVCLDQQASVDVEGEKLEYDLVVLASGINVKSISVLGLDYVPPKTRTMAQDELKVVLKNQDKRDRLVINSDPGYGKELMPRPPVPFFLAQLKYYEGALDLRVTYCLPFLPSLFFPSLYETNVLPMALPL